MKHSVAVMWELRPTGNGSLMTSISILVWSLRPDVPLMLSIGFYSSGRFLIYLKLCHFLLTNFANANANEGPVYASQTRLLFP